MLTNNTLRKLVLFSLFGVLGFPGIKLISPDLTVMAQSGSTTGMIVGRVKDVGGAVIAGAPVKARQIETNLERTADADEDGNYQFLQLPPGNYEVVVELEGFAPKKERVLINIGTSALVQMTLVPEGAVETVNVEAAVSFARDKTESSAINGADRIDNLPINRRNFLDFAVTSPRVTVDRLPVQGVVATSGLSFNGQSSRQNNITIDGLDNNDSTSGTVRSTFSQEAVREFQVVSDSYSAEFGRALGGVVNIVTKGGSNDHHGTAFFFVRNDAVSARNAFSEINPPYKQYQFGTTVGGPIKKDKYFYFASFERLSVKQNNIVTIPDQVVESAHRLGFSYVANGPQPFALGSTSLLGRADLQLTPNDLLTLRYNYGGTFDGNFEPFGANIDRSGSATQRLNDNQIAASNTYINGNLNLVNESRFLYSRRSQDVVSDYPGPLIRIEGELGRIVFGKSVFTNQPRELSNYQLVNNISLSRGNHQLKFGVDFLHLTAQNRIPNREQGAATFANLDLRFIDLPGDGFFTALQTFDPATRTPAQREFLTALAPLLPLFAYSQNYPTNLPLADLPLPQAYGQGFFSKDQLSVTQKFFSLFAQDDIKVRDNLLVKLGVRYDLFRTDLYAKNNGNFSPRIAISYSPKKFPRLSTFLTYGFFYAPPNISPLFVVYPQPRDISFQLLPDSILSFSRPTRNFPVSDQVPEGLGFVPQFGLGLQIQPDLHTSYTQQGSLGFTFFLNQSSSLNVSYNYVRGIRLFGLRDVNPVVRVTSPLQSENFINGRIDTTRGAVTEFGTTYDSYYHGATVSFNRRFSNRVGFLANYTYAKSIDNTFDYAGVVQEIEYVFNLRSERSLSVQDTRHRLTVSGNWDLSYTKNKFLRDFSVSTIISMNTGRPYNLVVGQDLNFNDIPFDRPEVVGPDGVRRPVGRNAGITPGFANVDFRLTRTLSFKEKINCLLIAEVFNLFNRVNIDQINRFFPLDPSGNFNLPSQENGRYIVTRDRYLSSFSPRLFQFGVRVTF